MYVNFSTEYEKYTEWREVERERERAKREMMNKKVKTLHNEYKRILKCEKNGMKNRKRKKKYKTTEKCEEK